MKTYTKYYYKDACRDYWTFACKKSKEFTKDCYEDVHCHWQWTAEKSGVGFDFEDTNSQYVVASGTIVGQYDLYPSLQDILNQFSFQMMCIAVGASKHAKESQ